MKNRVARFLILSIVCISVLCVIVFSFMAYRMNKRGAAAIGELGSIYMTGMSEQIATHFGTTFELRLSQVGALVDSVPAEGHDSESIRVALRYNGHARGFDHLALVGADGGIEMIYGRQIEIAEEKEFLASLVGGEGKMGVGEDESGEKLVLMGIRAEYPMSDGGTSSAFVAALPVTYISETLSSEEDENDLIYYFIIDKEGDFIACDSDVEDTNYFQRVRDRYDEIKASGTDGYGSVDREEYLTRLRKAMDSNRNFTGEFSINGVRRYLYGTGLPSSEWYLLLFMPYGQIDNTVNALGREWSWAAVISTMAILAGLSILTGFYLSMTRKHVREIEEARLLAERANKAKSEFLSNISHDIRTPMNGIVGMAAIAKSNLEHPQQVENCLNKIELSSKHLLGLINDILDMSKIESGRLELHAEKIYFQDALQSVVNIVQPQANAKGQRFDVYVFEPDSEPVLCDGVRFNQILINLLGNAVKFTPEGGSVRLECRVTASPKGENFKRILIRVKDTGIGMSKEFQNKIFDAFAREDSKRVQKTEGTGLGMAITKYIVDAMNGTIEVESEPNRGTEFKVVLDFERAAEHRETLSMDALIVSKDASLRESAAEMFASLGAKALCAEDGAMAEAKAQSGTLGAVLIDGDSDEAMALIARMQTLCGKECLVALLDSSEEAEERARIAGCAYLSKPLFRQNFLRAVREPDAGGETRERVDFAGKRILLAEDNELNREIAEELLSEIGFQIDSAENGKICVDKFSNSDVGWYDAVLMDIRMPIMSGYEATRAIRAMSRPDAATIPIIAMSADAFSDDVERCLACGMNAHTSKPIDMEVVSELMKKYLK